ncbi:MAG TPA: D-hexose-6-phosphate mutarotase [Lysobacter sp.]
MPVSVESFELHDRPCIRLRRGEASAEVSLHGAQVLSWKPAPTRERLYLSPASRHAAGTAIRGGIPVIFPQFAGRGPLAKHGFARLRDWEFLGLGAGVAGEEVALFELSDDATTRASWPHAFRARLEVALLPGALQVGLDILNRGDAPFAFTVALHTYLRVGRLPDVDVRGLESTGYEDTARAGAAMPPAGAPVRFDGEVDRIYADTPRSLVLQEPERALHVEAEGFRDTIVWNPGATLAASIGDLGAGEHLRFVCVESGSVLQPVMLAPGERWLGIQRLRE